MKRICRILQAFHELREAHQFVTKTLVAKHLGMSRYEVRNAVNLDRRYKVQFDAAMSTRALKTIAALKQAPQTLEFLCSKIGTQPCTLENLKKSGIVKKVGQKWHFVTMPEPAQNISVEEYLQLCKTVMPGKYEEEDETGDLSTNEKRALAIYEAACCGPKTAGEIAAETRIELAAVQTELDRLSKNDALLERVRKGEQIAYRLTSKVWKDDGSDRPIAETQSHHERELVAA